MPVCLDSTKTKKCFKCGKIKETKEFHKDTRAKDGLKLQCIECRKLLRNRNKNQYEVQRKYHYLTVYGISIDEYNELFNLQNGCCAICKNPETDRYKNTSNIKRLSVDHCHKTGKTRALLCSKCNKALGQFQDSISILKSAISYLETYNNA